jgi:hypothetical protein
MNRFITLMAILPLFISGSLYAQEKDTEAPGIAVFAELVGKGFASVNVDFRLNDKHRFSVGATSLDYEVVSDDHSDGYKTHNWISPGVMYYFLPGKGAHRIELGAGISVSPFLNRTYDSDIDSHTDSPISLHGVFGYRYQSKKKFFLRAGFTPFYRPKVWFLPLPGISLGYSW